MRDACYQILLWQIGFVILCLLILNYSIKWKKVSNCMSGVVPSFVNGLYLGTTEEMINTNIMMFFWMTVEWSWDGTCKHMRYGNILGISWEYPERTFQHVPQYVRVSLPWTKHGSITIHQRLRISRSRRSLWLWWPIKSWRQFYLEWTLHLSHWIFWKRKNNQLRILLQSIEQFNDDISNGYNNFKKSWTKYIELEGEYVEN